MKEYCCNKCGKEFMQKIDLLRHSEKKYPCISEHELTIMIKSDNEDLTKLETLFNKLRNILRDNESITGKDALDVISDILFLRLINPMLKKSQSRTYFDVVDYVYTNDKANTYKKYIVWSNIIALVKKIKKDDELEDREELHTIVQTIFNIIFRLHPETKTIFNDKLFLIKKSITLVKIFEEINKINFEDIDVDIKGKAYELTIQKEASVSKDFGQFFTPRWVVKYMINELNPLLNKDGSFDNVLDPACGTAGFISEYYKFIKSKADKDDITLQKNSGKKLYGYEIVPKTRELALVNILLNTGVYNENIKGEDFLISSSDYSEKKFKGHILTNPPFSMDKDTNNIFSKGNVKEYGNIFPVKTKSGTFLFLQACTNIIEDGYNVCMVSPNGKEIFGKGKDHIEIRKNVVNICDLYKIAILPSQSFKPYTGVETLILFMKKGTKTKEITFIQLSNVKDVITEKIIVKVKYDKLKDKNYSWNYKDYLVEDVTKNEGTLKYEKLGEICEFNTKSKRNASFGQNDGNYNFYSSSMTIKKCDNADYLEKSIIIGTGGNGSLHYDNVFSCSSDNFILKNNDKCDLRYVYLYLKSNFDILQSGFKGTTIKHITKEFISGLKIPVPPFEVQEEIIKELDSYYKTKDAIQVILNETSQRKKGNFEMLVNQCSNVKLTKLEDILERKNSGKTNSGDITNNGDYPFYSATSCNPSGSHKSYDFDGNDYFIFAKSGGNSNVRTGEKLGIGKFWLTSGKTCGNVATIQFENKTSNSTIFIDYYLKCILFKIQNLAEYCTGNGNINVPNMLKNTELCMPSKEDQEKIVEEMKKEDDLEKILNDKLKNLDIVIKNRFDYHINKCKDVKQKKTSKTVKEEKKVVSDSDNESNSDSDNDSDNGFDNLNISKVDLKKINVGIKDCNVYYYHEKNNCIYGQSMKTKKWSKPKKLQQKELLKMLKNMDSCSDDSDDSDDSNKQNNSKPKKKVIKQNNKSESKDEKPKKSTKKNIKK